MNNYVTCFMIFILIKIEISYEHSEWKDYVLDNIDLEKLSSKVRSIEFELQKYTRGFNIMLKITNSTINFYNRKSIFKNIHADFRIYFEKVNLIGNVPSSIFENCTVSTLSFNLCEFNYSLKSYPNDIPDKNTKISSLYFQYITQGFSETIISKHLYRHVKQVYFWNTPIMQISSEFLLNTYERPFNIRYFYLLSSEKEKISFQWLKYITNEKNPNAKYNNKIRVIITLSDLNDEEDLCKFRSYKKSENVFPLFLFTNYHMNLTCNCVIYWLHSYLNENNYVNHFEYENERHDAEKIKNTCFSNSYYVSKKIHECNFDKRLKECNNVWPLNVMPNLAITIKQTQPSRNLTNKINNVSKIKNMATSVTRITKTFFGTVNTTASSMENRGSKPTLLVLFIVIFLILIGVSVFIYFYIKKNSNTLPIVDKFKFFNNFKSIGRIFKEKETRVRLDQTNFVNTRLLN